MAFVRDFKEGKKAEKVVSEYLQGKHAGVAVAELARDRQKEGDLSIGDFTVEVKYDKMARDTGNLCFEIDNGKGPSGIASTLAKVVYYVVPDTKTLRLYGFDAATLRAWLFDNKNSHLIKVVNGGDRKAFTLLIVKLEMIAEILKESIDYAELPLPV